MVKAAGEILCQELAKAYPRLRIRWPRIPRVLTDQTATVAQAQAADAVDVMQRILSNEDPALS